jgi:rhodanese-related sulfurtransferase
VIVAEPGRETEAKVRLARIGFDRVRGAVIDVERVLAENPALAATATRLPAAEFASWRSDADSLQLVDVRNLAEHDVGVIDGAISIPLPTLLERLNELDRARPTVVYCATGVRSSIAASLLRTKGFTDVADILGGYDAWRAAALPTS